MLIAALRSRRGAAHRLLWLVGSEKFEINASAPLILEYEAIAKKLIEEIPLTEQDIDEIIDYLCAVANHRKVFYLWRPVLRDPKDDMVLQLAVAASCDSIVTYNQKDFEGTERFDLRVMTPQEFLKEIGELP